MAHVFCNGLLAEQYIYNANGQRIRRMNGWADGTVRFVYDERGCCLLAGDRFYAYDGEGNLVLVRTPAGETRFRYQNTLLREGVLPDGARVAYAYNGKGKNPVCPVAKYRNGELAVTYVWRDIRFLEYCVDHRSGFRYDFSYNDSNLSAVRLSDVYGAKRMFLQVWCDQAGTPKLFTTVHGRHVKELAYDSFGMLQDDTNPDLLIPIGFAGGLVDGDTGLVRFGFRDYDPFMGRFTCPDPLGDTGGDHDRYDYCVDDPVNLNDPAGLFPPLLAFLGGKALALGIAALGAYGSAYIVDTIKSFRDGKKSSEAMDAMSEVAPIVAGVSAVPVVAAAVTRIPGAVAAAEDFAGKAILGVKHGEKIAKGSAKFLEGFINPNAPVSPSLSGAAGTVTARLAESLGRGNKKR